MGVKASQGSVPQQHLDVDNFAHSWLLGVLGSAGVCVGWCGERSGVVSG